MLGSFFSLLLTAALVFIICTAFSMIMLAFLWAVISPFEITSLINGVCRNYIGYINGVCGNIGNFCTWIWYSVYGRFKKTEKLTQIKKFNRIVPQPFGEVINKFYNAPAIARQTIAQELHVGDLVHVITPYGIFITHVKEVSDSFAITECYDIAVKLERKEYFSSMLAFRMHISTMAWCCIAFKTKSHIQEIPADVLSKQIDLFIRCNTILLSYDFLNCEIIRCFLFNSFLFFDVVYPYKISKNTHAFDTMFIT